MCPCTGVALFADYHFVVPEGDRAWKSKKGLADAAFEQIRDFSAGKAFSDDEVYVTNLCNDELPNHPPRKGDSLYSSGKGGSRSQTY